MDFFNNQNIASKLITESSCSKYDISYNLLKKENELLMKHIEDGQKKDDDITDEFVRNDASIFNITIVYTLLFIIIGVFYNSLLTSSIGKILNEDVKLIDFLGEGNTLNYDLIWVKLQSCVNNYRFYLFVVTFVATLLINVGIIYIIILKGQNINHALKIVSITSVAVIGVTSLLANNVSFVKIFENTIGYAISTLFSPKKDHSFLQFMNSLFIHESFGKGGIDFSFLFTAFRLDNLGDIIRDIGLLKPESKYDFYIKNDGGLNNDLNLLSNAVVMKNTVGYMTWTLFSSITATIISMKYLVRQL
jgi:hypothetical protein